MDSRIAKELRLRYASARPYIDPDLPTFTVPWRMFEEMEGNVAGSFLEKAAWRQVRARIGE